MCAPSRIRTCGLLLRRQLLYPLSYRGWRGYHSTPLAAEPDQPNRYAAGLAHDAPREPRVGRQARRLHGQERAVQVRDVMTEATVTDSTTDTLRSAAERMWRQQTGSLLVMDDGRLAGIITERDLLRAVALGADLATATVDEAMTTEVFTVSPDMPLVDAAREMATRWIRHLPVKDGGRLVGMVSMRDVTGIFAALAPGTVSVEYEFDQLVRERRLARIEPGDLD
jgi:CBS domain-containing protein